MEIQVFIQEGLLGFMLVTLEVKLFVKIVGAQVPLTHMQEEYLDFMQEIIQD